MGTAKSKRTAAAQLRRDERAALLRRRRRAGFTNAQARQAPLVGLALSGGGVRSATFALGLLRGLAAQGLLRRVDYLSSVSGGGFTAAMYGRLVSAVGLDEAQRILGAGHSGVLDWLRRNGRYLTPAGSRDLGIAAVSFLRSFSAVHIEAFFALLVLSLLVTLPHLLQAATGALDPQAWQDWWSPWLALALVAVAVCVPGLLMGYWGAPEAQPGTGMQRRWFAGDVLLLTVLLVAAIGVTGLAATSADGHAASLGGLRQHLRQAELGWPLLALAGWSAAMGQGWAMLRLARSREPRPLAVLRLRQHLTVALRLAMLGALALGGMGLLDIASWTLLRQLKAAPGAGWLWGGLSLGAAALVVLRALAAPLQQLAAKAMADSSRALGPMLLDVGGRLATVVLVLAWLVVVQWWVFDPSALELLRPLPSGLRWLLLALAAAAWWGLTSRYAEAVNASSLYSFYQARLVGAYLSAGNPRRGLWSTPEAARAGPGTSVTDVLADDDVPLTRHRPEQRGGPIQLVNTCLNQTRDDASGLFNADRKGTVLTVSARALELGAHDVVPWTDCRGADPDEPQARTLGHWVAVSGAAVAPGAGSYTSGGWALVMFLLGIRLGYWMPNPLRQPARGGRLSHWLWHHLPKPLMLWGEASATFHGRAQPWWYLSDGGHFDNTGVYALLKRECDFIVCADASADPRYQLADIENLVRKARIDLDAEIEFYPREAAAQLMSLGGTGLAVLSPEDLADNVGCRGVLLARVRYRRSDPARAEREATLLVIKPHLHAALDMDLLAYAARRPAFPHESTGDQFFDEAQWESYQRLGQDFGLAFYDRWLAQLYGWDKPLIQTQPVGTRLRQPEAPVTTPSDAPPTWRRPTKAAVIGTSVGMGVLGSLLLGLWQINDQFTRQQTERQQAADKLVAEVAQAVDALDTACPHLSPLRISQLRQLRKLKGSRAMTTVSDLTLAGVEERMAQVCEGKEGTGGTCPADAETARANLCAQLQDTIGATDALNYWSPPLQEQPMVRDWRDLWALLRGLPLPAATPEVAQPTPATTGEAPAAAPPQASSPATAALPSEPEAARLQPAPPPVAAARPGAAPAHAPDSAPEQPAAGAASPPAAAPKTCAGVTLFIQIYDDEARVSAERLRQALDASTVGGLRAAPLENVTRSAQLRGSARPVPYVQPTLIAHDKGDLPCALALQPTIADRWCANTGDCVRVARLPSQFKSSPGTLELWLPTLAQDRPAAAR